MDFAHCEGVGVRVDVSADWVVAMTHTLVGVELCAGRGDNLGTEGGFVVDVECSTLAAEWHGGCSAASCPVVQVGLSVAGRLLCGRVRQRLTGVIQEAAMSAILV